MSQVFNQSDDLDTEIHSVIWEVVDNSYNRWGRFLLIFVALGGLLGCAEMTPDARADLHASAVAARANADDLKTEGCAVMTCADIGEQANTQADFVEALEKRMNVKSGFVAWIEGQIAGWLQ